MKNFLDKLLAILAFNGIAYAFIAFMALDINPLEWGWFGRLILALVAFSSILAILTDDENDNKFKKMW